MCKKLIYLISFVLVLSLAGDVQAATVTWATTVTWTDAGPDSLWSTAANWDSDQALPTSIDDVDIGFWGHPAHPGPTIASGNAVANCLKVGVNGEGTLTVDGGTLTTTNELSVAHGGGSAGTLNMKSGAIIVGSRYHVARAGTGNLNMTGGAITVNGHFIIGSYSEATAHVQLDGGTINAGGPFEMGMAGSVSTMDIEAGTLIIAGNALAKVQGYIDNGWITAYGGNGTLHLDFDTITGKTTLFATGERLNMIPDNGATVLAGEFDSQYNVAWDSPSDNALGSMPTGNGDIGLNVWVEGDGDLLFYIAKTDAWTEKGWELAKLGRVRVRLTPNPFAKGSPFRQVLQTRKSQIVITAGPKPNPAELRVWVDANHPVVHVEVKSKKPRDLRITVESWRTADRFLEKQKDRVVWYHRNERSYWRSKMRFQHIESTIEKLSLKDPLMHRTFGGMMKANGLIAESPDTLRSSAPLRRADVRIHLLTAQTDTAVKWLAQLEKNVARYDALPIDRLRREHLDHWRKFWDRSWIRIRPAAEGEPPLSRGYALQRYITACAGRGNYPIKFNGSLFVDGYTSTMDVTVPRVPRSPDSRNWGAHYWFQNTRLIYWPLLATGDFEQMQPLFKMFKDILPMALLRTQIYYDHGGAFFPETQDFFGTYRTEDYDFDMPVSASMLSEPRKSADPGLVRSPWIRYEYQGGLELSAMMLDYYAYTQDRRFAAETLVPMADAVLRFYYEHYPREKDGRLRIYPSNALENWGQGPVANPTDSVAGLHWVLAGLKYLPDELSTEQQRDRWDVYRKTLPRMPKATEGDKPIIGSEQTGTHRYGREMPELYAIFPYRLYGVGKPDLEMARHTFKTRKLQKLQDQFGWVQTPVQAAYLGLTEDARQLAVQYLTTYDKTRRFPAFWGPNFDDTPDQDHGGNCLMVLQRMLLHAEGEKIILLPAWPKEWDVQFKLHAPHRTVIECEFRDGRIRKLNVTPESRHGDVVVSE